MPTVSLVWDKKELAQFKKNVERSRTFTKDTLLRNQLRSVTRADILRPVIAKARSTWGRIFKAYAGNLRIAKARKRIVNGKYRGRPVGIVFNLGNKKKIGQLRHAPLFSIVFGRYGSPLNGAFNESAYLQKIQRIFTKRMQKLFTGKSS